MMNEQKLDEYIKPYGFIYCIHNTMNNKRYIGATTNPKGVRRAWTLNGLKQAYNKNTHLMRALEKYGIENFERIRLDSAKNKEELDSKEEFYIQKYNTLDRKFGYNFKHGGNNGKHLEETKQKISKAHKGRIHTEKARRNMSNGQKGKKLPEETKKKLAEASKGNNYALGYKHTEEMKKRLSEANKGRIKSKETRRKLSEANKGQIPWIKGKHHSEETKKKISEAQKGEKGNNYGKKHSDEQKQKISEGLKRYWKERKEREAKENGYT